MTSRRIDLPSSEMPQSWYNIVPDLPRPPDPPLHPVTKQPVTAEDMAPIFPMNLLAQEMSGERYIEIPDEVLHAYALYRPTPLYRAVELEKALDTPAHIYYKFEAASPAGSHKPNTAIPQAYYNKIEGTKRITTETGAGQWGSALSMACRMFGLECVVYMVGISYDQKPYRRTLMETWAPHAIGVPRSAQAWDESFWPKIPIIPARWALLSLKPWRMPSSERIRNIRWAVCSIM